MARADGSPTANGHARGRRIRNGCGANADARLRARRTGSEQTRARSRSGRNRTRSWVRLLSARFEDLKQTLRQTGILDDRTEQNQPHPRVLVAGDSNQRLMKLRIATEAFCTANQPKVELALGCRERGNEFG